MGSCKPTKRLRRVVWGEVDGCAYTMSVFCNGKVVPSTLELFIFRSSQMHRGNRLFLSSGVHETHVISFTQPLGSVLTFCTNRRMVGIFAIGQLEFIVTIVFDRHSTIHEYVCCEMFVVLAN